VRSDLGPPNHGEALDIRVIGVGGGGCNAVDRLFGEGLAIGEVWALNTDAQHLLGVHAHHKLLLGRHVCRGRSANADPRIGELAAEEARLELAESLKGVRLAFLLAGLGGGTGSGSLPIIAKIARELRTTTVAFVTQPFAVEGKVRLENARASLDRLRANADFVSVFSNDRLITEHPGLSLRDALRKADEELFRPVRALHRVARRVDFPRLRRRLRGTTVSGAASAVAPRQRGYILAMERALDSLAHLKNHHPNSAVVAVGTGGDLNQGERDAMLRMALDALSPDGTVLWGYYDDQRLAGTCEISVFLSRVDGSRPRPEVESVG
jgi:cell division protein FtsZ